MQTDDMPRKEIDGRTLTQTYSSENASVLP